MLVSERIPLMRLKCESPYFAMFVDKILIIKSKRISAITTRWKIQEILQEILALNLSSI